MRRCLIAVGTLALVFLQNSLLAQTQVVNLSSGVNNNTSAIIPTGNYDDTWTVSYPGSSGFTSSVVSSGSYLTSNQVIPYPCQIAQARWISPFVNGSGVIYGVAGTVGNTIYRTIVNLNHGPCDSLDSAKIVFPFISGDNRITKIRINNTDFNLPSPGIGFSACSSYTLNIPNPTSVLQSGSNTIEIYNYNESLVTAILLDGDLKIWASGYTIPLGPNFNFTSTQPFCSGSTASVDGSISTGPITKYWWFIQQCTSTGVPITAGVSWGGNWVNGSNPGILNFASLVPCGNYYRIYLKVMDACGYVWNAPQSIPFKLECSPDLDVWGSTMEICMGGTPAFSLFSNCGTCMVQVTNLTTNAAEYYGPANLAILASPIYVTTNYNITIYGQNSACPVTIPWTVYVIPNTIPVDFTGSASQVCPPGSPFPLVADASAYANFPNCNMTIVEQSTNNTVYSGPASVALMLSLPVTETYVVTVTDASTGCMSIYYWTVVVDDCGVDNGGGGDTDPGKRDPVDESARAQDILATVYPNPSSGTVNVVTNGFTGQIEVLDALGRPVCNAPVTGTKKLYTLDLSAQPKGIYTVKASGDGHTNRQRIVLQ